MSDTDITIELLMDDVTASDDRTEAVQWARLVRALDAAGRAAEAELILDDTIDIMFVAGEVCDANERTYTYHEEGGHEEELAADDMDEAVEMASDLCRRGDWGTDGALVEVWITETDPAGDETDRRDIRVAIEPDHDTLIERAGGDTDCDHDWTSEGEGGCDSNPGVHSHGGTSMSFAAHCRHCGLHRVEHHCGSQHNPGEHDTVEYEQPDSWCEDCQSEECECDDD